VFVQAAASGKSISKCMNLATVLRGGGATIRAATEHITANAVKMTVTLWCHFAVSDALTSNHSARISVIDNPR
jgi:hypothetical protein